MSQAPSRPSSPKPPNVLNVVEASLGDDTTPDFDNFVEPIIFFKIQSAIFGLPRSRVLKSGFFRGMMESPHLGDFKEGSAEYPITFDDRAGIKKGDMQSFCAVLDLRAFEPAPTLSVAEWASAYRLSKMWEFEQVHHYIYKHLDELVKDPLERIELADCLGLKEWVAPALAQLSMPPKRNPAFSLEPDYFFGTSPARAPSPIAVTPRTPPRLSPDLLEFLQGGEANVEDDTTSNLLNFVEPTIVFKVQNALFGLPRSQVLKSGFLRDMVESPHLGESNEGTTEHPIVIDHERTGITKKDMKSFCAILDVRAFQSELNFSIAEWASAYRLARMWEFEQLRDHTFKHLDESITDPFTRIDIADVLGLDRWIAPALAQLCRRETALTAAEGERLGFKRLTEVCRLREHPRQQFPLSDYEKWLNKGLISRKY
ncbi:hypothetical protein FRC00_005725 [Tulasnella sp. 408]|nr:hypothetical protein FRC00_005725 [Tulasnella sp. 408]